MPSKRKIPLGSPVIVDTLKSKYNFSNESNKEIAFMPEGIVTAYCNEVPDRFLIIRLRSNIEIKISENELSECTKKFYFSDKSNSSDLLKLLKDFINIEFDLTGNKKIEHLLNPFTFLRWVNYVIKDIF